MQDTFSGVLHNHGSKPRFTDPDTGRVYECAYLDLVAITEFDEWLADRALQLVYQSRSHLSNEDYRTSLREVNAEILSGKYAFGAERSNEAMRSTAGGLKLMEILISDVAEKRRLTRAELSSLLFRRGQEIKELVDRVVQMSKPREDAGSGGEGAEGNALPAAVSR